MSYELTCEILPQDGGVMRLIIFERDEEDRRSVYDIFEISKGEFWSATIPLWSRKLAKDYKNELNIDPELAEKTDFCRVRTNHGRLRKAIWQTLVRYNRENPSARV